MWCVAWIVLAVLSAWWAIGLAVYRSDDFLTVGSAWAAGSVSDAFDAWWRLHSERLGEDVWPKFYRPIWRGLFLLDAHAFGFDARLSVALSWICHVLTSVVIGRTVLGWTWREPVAWSAACMALLAAPALQAVAWVSARGTCVGALFGWVAVALASSAVARTGPRGAFVVRVSAFAMALWLAFGSNEEAVAFGVVGALAALWLAERSQRTRAWTVAAVAVGATAAWIVLRRLVLGVWIGGYPKTEAAVADEGGFVVTVVGGLGALAIPGGGPVAGALLLAAGGVAMGLIAFAALCAHRAGRRAGARLLALALCLLALCLAAHMGARWRAAGSANGRYLYMAWSAWSVIAAIVLHEAWCLPVRWGRGLAALGLAALVYGGVASQPICGMVCRRRGPSRRRSIPCAGRDRCCCSTSPTTSTVS